MHVCTMATVSRNRTMAASQPACKTSMVYSGDVTLWMLATWEKGWYLSATEQSH